MNKSMSWALVAAGILLTILGVREFNSYTSDISRMFNGEPTDRSMWMLVGGVALAVSGMIGLALRTHGK